MNQHKGKITSSNFLLLDSADINYISVHIIRTTKEEKIITKMLFIECVHISE